MTYTFTEFLYAFYSLNKLWILPMVALWLIGVTVDLLKNKLN